MPSKGENMGRRFGDLSDANKRADALDAVIDDIGREEFVCGLARYFSSQQVEELLAYFEGETDEDEDEDED